MADEPKPKRTPWLIAVGNQFRALRSRQRKNQADLGTSPTTIVKLEKGYGARLDVIERACHAMGVHPSAPFASPAVVESVPTPASDVAVLIRDRAEVGDAQARTVQPSSAIPGTTPKQAAALRRLEEEVRMLGMTGPKAAMWGALSQMHDEDIARLVQLVITGAWRRLHSDSERRPPGSGQRGRGKAR